MDVGMNKAKLKRLGLNALFLIVLYILQAFAFPRLAVWGVKPLLIPVAVIGIGFFSGGIWGGVFGIFAGIFCDTAFHSTVFFTLILPLFGLASGLVSEYMLLPGIISYLISAFLGLIIISFLQTFPLVVFQDTNLFAIGRVTLLQIAYSLILVLVLYYPIRLISARKS